ncbi:hypothetical protein CCACVL1_00873 [Corchorus capsularis]|uniref:Uncharacterized protein n=1 Tax=Corchorus capsularis TaxID=210143 RepID=A0A1R3KTY5_COCAP|nr:hypothetical protein CCACVL1_00873 [Corchorus capsularis]
MDENDEESDQIQGMKGGKRLLADDSFPETRKQLPRGQREFPSACRKDYQSMPMSLLTMPGNEVIEMGVTPESLLYS